VTYERDTCDGCYRVLPLNELRAVYHREPQLLCIDSETCWAIQDERRKKVRHQSQVAQALQEHHRQVARGEI
jgi:hypothetical protein